MSSKKEYWDIPLSPHQKEQLDEELLAELNRHLEDDSLEQNRKQSRRTTYSKVASFMLALLMILLALGRLLNIFTLPPMEFLGRSRELSQIPEMRELQQAVVSIDAGSRRGTGFNIDPAGVIVTNYHVVGDARTIVVSFAAGFPYPGEMAVAVPPLDLALLKIPGETLPVLELAQDARLLKGDTVLIIGNPLGLTRIIHEGLIEGYVQLQNWDAPVLMIKGPVFPGSSGSPVFNQKGEVVAVIFATLQLDETRPDIIGLAIPIQELTALLENLP
jgi:serine protease Do